MTSSAEEVRGKHSELVERARLWLMNRQRCELVVTEISLTGLNEPDAIGWRQGHSTLIECKASRSDFRADRWKVSRRFEERAVGQERYYLTPKGLLTAEEVGTWGLLELHGNRIFTVKESDTFTANKEQEIRFIISIIQRSEKITDGMTGIACRYYTGIPGVESKNRATATVAPREELERHTLNEAIEIVRRHLSAHKGGKP